VTMLANKGHLILPQRRLPTATIRSNLTHGGGGTGGIHFRHGG
jgi:hypothetical protein